MITGGTGFLGQNLARYLAELGHEVVIVGRRAPAAAGPWRYEAWDARSLGPWAAALDGARAVVNLAGRTVDCVKTPDHCDEILRSRIESTLAIGVALREAKAPPPVWVQMSTAHIYGDPPELVCDEASALGYGLAPSVGKAWEAAFQNARPAAVRGVVLRTSFVLGRSGGALQRLAKLGRMGLGGRIGHGRQGMSWLHERDMNRIFEWAIDTDASKGVYIATAPTPRSNAEFMRALRGALRMTIGLPAPAFGVRLAAPLLMRTDPELALYGRYCVPTRLLSEGFRFEFTELDAALRDLLSSFELKRA